MNFSAHKDNCSFLLQFWIYGKLIIYFVFLKLVYNYSSVVVTSGVVVVLLVVNFVVVVVFAAVDDDFVVDVVSETNCAADWILSEGVEADGVVAFCVVCMFGLVFEVGLVLKVGVVLIDVVAGLVDIRKWLLH